MGAYISKFRINSLYDEEFSRKSTQEILALYEMEIIGPIIQCLPYLLRPAIVHMRIPQINN